jgi:hypothetical protein
MAQNLPRLINVFLLAVLACTRVAAAASTRVCANDLESTSQFAGEYTSDTFLETLRRTRSVPEAFEAERTSVYNSSPTAVIVHPGRILLTDSWHEGEDAECVLVDGDRIQTPTSTKILTRIGARTSDSDTGDYFDVIFSGCFLDQNKDRWCFETNSIDVAGKRHSANLVLDLMETWPETGVHIESDNDHFWFFRPSADGGWLVFQGGWASDGSPEPDWKNPWRILSPIEK